MISHDNGVIYIDVPHSGGNSFKESNAKTLFLV